jgi:hypothetical protein
MKKDKRVIKNLNEYIDYHNVKLKYNPKLLLKRDKIKNYQDLNELFNIFRIFISL